MVAPDSTVEPTTQARAAERVALLFLYAYVASIPVEALGSLPGIGGSISRPIGLLAIAAAGAVWVTERRVPRLVPAHLALAAFVAWSALSSVWSIVPELSLSRTATYLPLLVLMIASTDLVRDRVHLGHLASAWCAGAALVVVDVALEVPGAMGESGVTARITAVGLNQAVLSVVAAISVAVAVLRLQLPNTGWPRALAWFVIATGPLVVLLSAGRAGLLALIPSAVFGGWKLLGHSLSDVSRGAKVTAALVVLAFVAVTALVVPRPNLERLDWVVSPASTDASIGTRSTLLSDGLEVFGSNPVLGVGARGFKPAIEDLGSRPRVAHNTALSIGAELGLVGLALFAVALWFVWHPLRRLPQSPRWAARGVFIAWSIGALTLTWEHTKTSWFVMSLLLVAGLVVQEE